MTNKEIMAELSRLKAENERLLAKTTKTFGLKVSEKGCVAITGIRRFPIALYRGEMELILSKSAEIRQFISANASKLATKD